MHEQLKLRLEELKKEFEIGQKRMLELERQQISLRETLLRISGAVQVLEEVMANNKGLSEDHPETASIPLDDPAPALYPQLQPMN
ncbi:MAG TPA: hypothetical protein VFV58_06705 [Blastocatellia bacterium]|jgi:hypothetical protein|nr:hypothetical protein [Blastocatellia bacterium]